MHGDLSDYLSKNRNVLSLDKKIEILLKTANCVDFLHGKKIIHFDIKGSNFLVDEHAAIIKIADFGISKLKTTNETSFDSSVEQAGTPGYRPPELKEGNYGYHTDVYSFGIMMFEIVFEISRHTDDELLDVDFQKKVLEGKRPNLEQFGTLSDEKLKKLVELMKECWDSKVNHRPDMKEIIDHLQKIQSK
jgi:serine/threonine protein kinase